MNASDARTDLPRSAAALERRAAQGRPARLWLRDDDAVADTPALGRLIGWSSRHGVPVLLAVIPADARKNLVRRLTAAPALTPCQHGLAHRNYAPEGRKSAEFGAHRPLAAMIGDLERGQSRMRELFGPRAAPVFVPPWNSVTPDLLAPLAGLGFTSVSTFGPAHLPHADITEINTDLDIIGWRSGKIGRALPDLDENFARLLGAAGDAPVGILTHHLAHDAAAWRFLEALGGIAGAIWIDITRCHSEDTRG